VKALERQRNTLLPLAEEKIALSMAAWRGGGGSLADLVTARRERIENETQSIELERQRLKIAARLHYTYEEMPGEQP
jgi:outer membrane protein TolC